MAKGKTWLFSEEKILIENYASKTIKELLELFPGRNEEAINSKIKRLKVEGKIDKKDDETIKRSYEQRSKPLFTVDQVNTKE